jgi:hypothetical protein
LFSHFTSSRSSKYIMVVYNYDSNAILTELITSHSKSELLYAYTKTHVYLLTPGLDNEAPGHLKAFMRANSVAFELVTSHNHRCNATKKAIGMWKDHVIAVRSSLDPNFPIHLWCRLLPRSTTTLNLLCQSHINPRLYAEEAHLNRAFNFKQNFLGDSRHLHCGTHKERLTPHLG